MSKFQSILETVGNTPVVRINRTDSLIALIAFPLGKSLPCNQWECIGSQTLEVQAIAGRGLQALTSSSGETRVRSVDTAKFRH